MSRQSLIDTSLAQGLSYDKLDFKTKLEVSETEYLYNARHLYNKTRQVMYALRVIAFPKK
jgi:hypothetical protein